MLEIAHGHRRQDRPADPEWLFGWGAAMVLVVSFVGLAILWPQPRLQDGGGFRALPAGSRGAAEPPGRDSVRRGRRVPARAHRLQRAAGSQTATNNFAPSFVFVIFWLGWCRSACCSATSSGRSTPGAPSAGPWPGSRRRRARPAPAPLEYRADRPLAGGRGDLRVRRAGAGRVERRQAGERGDRGARVLGRHVVGDGALRRGLAGSSAARRSASTSTCFRGSRLLHVGGGELGLRRPLSGLAELGPVRRHRCRCLR